MNLEVLDDGYLFFLNEVCSLEKEEDISLFLKDMFLIINEVYSIELYGEFKVSIYIDEKIGMFVEIKKLDDYISYSKKIDTKVVISKCSFYFRTNDLSLIYKYRPIYKVNNNYYVSTKDVDDVLKLLDFCDIEFKNTFTNQEIILY